MKNSFAEARLLATGTAVWEYGCDEPGLQEIRFLAKEEAETIEKFSLYVYVCPYSFKIKKYPIEKRQNF